MWMKFPGKRLSHCCLRLIWCPELSCPITAEGGWVSGTRLSHCCLRLIRSQSASQPRRAIGDRRTVQQRRRGDEIPAGVGRGSSLSPKVFCAALYELSILRSSGRRGATRGPRSIRRRHSAGPGPRSNAVGQSSAASGASLGGDARWTAF